MKTRSKFRLCLLLLAALLFTCIPCSPLLQKAEAGTTYYLNLQLEGIQNYSAGHEMMTYINQERRAAGVPDLTLDKELTDVAMQRAAEIAYDFSHTRPNGTKCQTACSSGRMWGENIAAGNSTVYATHLQWMNSPPHKQSLLTSTHRGIGIGHFRFDTPSTPFRGKFTYFSSGGGVLLTYAFDGRAFSLCHERTSCREENSKIIG
jgi:uncharacterized protein YkwD